jgi:hypothetical protein
MSALERLCRLSSAILLAALGSIAWGTRISAQCPAPDNLDGGPCCTLTTESLPQFGKVSVSSLGICWRDCAVASVGPVRAVWTPLHILPSTGRDCGLRRNRLDVLTAGGGMLLWTGTMRLHYSRTWLETDPSGTGLQVWRFLVNGDLKPTALVAPAPCPLPPCSPALGGPVRFAGYIDYAQNCATGAVQIAWMLTHACDAIDHAPGFARAGAFHPGRSYTFVGPGAGFVPAPMVATEGTPFSPFEAVRRRRFPLPGTTAPVRCEYEERFGHSLTVTPLCLCTIGPPLSPQWVRGSLSGTGVCGTTIATPGGPFLPGFLSMGIGSWTIPGTYPGPEDLRWNAGGYDYLDPCTGALRPEVFFGVTTLGGYPAVQVTSGPGLPLPPIFIDQANSLSLTGATLMNVPYVSDHILNLNE